MTERSTRRAAARITLTLFALAGCHSLDELWSDATSTPSIDPAEAPNGPEEDAGAPQTEEDGGAELSAEDASVFPGYDDAALDAMSEDDASADDASALGDAADTRPSITSLTYRAPIVEAPESGSRWIGYVRTGGTVPILRGPLGNAGCPLRREVVGAGWYEVEGGGFMCVGNFAALTSEVQGRSVGRRLPTPPQVDASMPFRYAINWRPTVMYRWLPSRSDEREVEPERFPQRNTAPDGGTLPRGEGAPAPARDAGATAARDGNVRIEELAGTAGTPLLRRMTRGMYVSLDRAMRGSTGTFWRTQTGGFVRTGSVGIVRNFSTFQGQPLGEQMHLPVAFALSLTTSTYQPNGRGGFSPIGRVPRLTAFQLTDDPPVRAGSNEFYRTREGLFLRSRQVRVVTALAPPADLSPGEKWLDVNLDHQSVVAYEGATPVYVTVASTGRRNRNNPEENYETIQGGFRIQSKHVATTMDGNSANDGPYSIEDVPWVMYFEASFALHGAFWHEGYGMMRSHGCVNLAPTDARWFFNWSEPQVPPGWHGAYATAQRPGTRVYVHYDAQALGERGGPESVPQH
ncbi:MAG: L,D-transpeptidase [Polyangiales bacterium]